MFRNSAWIFCAILLFCGNICLGDVQNLPHRENKPDNAPSNSVQTAAVNPPQGTTDVTKPSSTPTQTSTSKPESSTKTEATTTPTTSATAANITSPNPKPTTTIPSSSPPSTTPPPSTGTSTHSPTTTPPSSTTPSSTTSIPVTPKPGPQKGSWNVTDPKRNITCIRIDGIFSIDYDYVFNKTVHKLHVDVPRYAHANGSCDDGKIRLKWENGSNTNNLEFIFKKNDTKKDATKYVLAAFSGEIFIPKLNSTHFNTNTNETHFETPVNQSYSCSAMKQIKVDDHTKVTLEDFQLQAFKVSNTTNFDASVDCAGNHPSTPDIVPIVVGCVLALLVIAVLVAYLISRRRSATRGYLSM